MKESSLVGNAGKDASVCVKGGKHCEKLKHRDHTFDTKLTKHMFIG